MPGNTVQSRIFKGKARKHPTCQDLDAPVQKSATDYGRLTIEDLAEICRLSMLGWTQRAIADVVGCSHQSVSYALQRMGAKAEHIQVLLKAQTLDATKAWGRAIEKAADRGDHRPARELIEAAHPELRPTQGSSAGGVGVTIVIGQPGQPVSLPTIDIAPAPVRLSPQLSDGLHSVTVDSKDDSVA